MKEYLSPASKGDGAPRCSAAAAAAAVVVPYGPPPRLGGHSMQLCLPLVVRAAEPVPISALINGVGQGGCKGSKCKYAVVPAAEGTCDLPQTKVRAGRPRGWPLLHAAAGLPGCSCVLACRALVPAAPRSSPSRCPRPPRLLLQIRLINEAAFAQFLFSIGEALLYSRCRGDGSRARRLLAFLHGGRPAPARLSGAQCRVRPLLKPSSAFGAAALQTATS